MPGQRVFRLLHREIRGLHEAAYVLALFTLGSQLVALLRDRLFAHTFGAGQTLDVFYAAFRIPDTLYALLASVVSLFVLIPFLEAAARQGEGAMRAFLSDMFSFFSGALIIVAVIAFFLAPTIASVLYPGFDAALHARLVPMIRILLLQPLLLGVSNLFAAYVQVKGRFLLYAISPILYNIGIIMGALFLYPVLGLNGLAWGVVLGAALHMSVQIPFMLGHHMLPRPVMPDWWRVREVVRLSIPRTITLSAQQIVLLVLVSLASFFASGSISSFTFAWNLQSVPLAIIGVSYSVAAFPKLARLWSGGEHGEYETLVLTAARQILFWALPVTVLFVVLRAQIVRVILGSGAFDWDATMVTGAVLALLVVSLVAQGLVVLLVRACYAAGKTFVPLVLNVGSAVVTIALAFGLLAAVRGGLLDLHAFARLMRLNDVASARILVVAAAYSLGSFVNALLLVAYFERRTGTFLRRLAPSVLQGLAGALAGGVVAYLGLRVIDDLVSLQTTAGVFLQGLGAGLAGLAAWLAVLYGLRSKDLSAAWAGIHRRLSKRRVRAARGSIEQG